MARLTDRLARRLHRPIQHGREVVGMAVQHDGVVLTIRDRGRMVTRRCDIVVAPPRCRSCGGCGCPASPPTSST
ncbi:hypothetical protein ACFQX7_31250 [Luedemannella flava]